VFSIPSIAEGVGGGGPVPPIPEPVHRSVPTVISNRTMLRGHAISRHTARTTNLTV
jgi:hypothetical protein